MSSNTSTEKRNLYLDTAKAFAILLVVVGHCIQYGSGAEYVQSTAFFSNPLFKAIYSFHMPLFMLISGYLFRGALRKPAKEIILGRARSLVVPIICWTTISLMLHIARSIGSDTLTLSNIVSTFLSQLTILWFLWAVFLWSVGVVIINKRLNDSIWVYIAVFLLLFATPVNYNIGLLAYMYPFFVGGYLYNHYNLAEKLHRIYSLPYLPLLLGAIFFAMLYHFDVEDYIYVSGYTLVGNDACTQLSIDLYRSAIGFVGSAFVLSSLYTLFHNVGLKRAITHGGIVADIGRNTLGIYVVSVYINGLTGDLTRSLSGLSYPLLLVESICTIALSMLIIKLIQRNRTLNRYLLGGKR